MKFEKMIMVTTEAEPTSEEWFIEIMGAEIETIKTPKRETFEKSFEDVPEEFQDIVKECSKQKLHKSYINKPKQFYSLIRHYGSTSWVQVEICHYYHFEMEYTTTVKF